MTKKTTFDPAEAAECAGHLAEIADRGRLAALGLAQPVLIARRAQLEREQLRLRTQLGKDHPRVAALDASIALAAGRINEVEIATEIFTVDPPETPEEGGVIFGRVTEKGHGRSDLVVSAVDKEGKVTGFGCTGPKGAFEFKVPKAKGLRLRVTDKAGAALWRDREDFDIDDGDVIRREIDLTAAGPECPAPGDDTGETPETAVVPDLVGRPEAEAQRLLLAASLTRGKRGEEESPGNVGRVIRQSPEAGSEVPRGSAVDIVVGISGGLEMPDLKGMPLEEALARIEELGLKAEDPKFTPSADFEGHVIQHTPTAGEKVKAGDRVSLLVGAKPKITMPDLRGLQQEEAERRLKELDLQAGEPRFIDDAERVGVVIRHSPLPGASVDPGSTVTLFVGRKPETPSEGREMPDLVGRPLEEAVKVLAEMRLKPEKTTFVRDPQRAGQVVRQSPQPGRVVTARSRISLTVASGNDSRDLRSVVVLVAQDPAVEAMDLTSETLLKSLRENDVGSLSQLEETAGSDARMRAVFGLRTAANARRLRAVLKAVIERMG